MAFSNQNREESRLKVKNKTFDLLIIGGGLTGASIALDASTRGMSTVLLEMSDFATKGSAREVMLTSEQENYQYKSRKQIKNEKTVLKTNFSPLCQSMTGIHLTYRDDYELKRITSIKKGLIFPFKRKYHEQSPKLLRKKEVQKLLPTINPKKLERGLQFQTGLIDCSLMTIELLKKAYRFGASPLNYFKVIEFIYDQDQKIIGVKAEDQINGQIVSFYAHQVINTTGQYLEQIRQLDRAKKKGDYTHSVNKETQLQVKLKDYPIKNVIRFNFPDKSGSISLAPYKDRLIVTVLEPVSHPTSFDPECSVEEIKDYLAVCQQVLGITELTEENIVNVNRTYSVDYQHKSSPSHLVATSESGLISFLGTSTLFFRLYASKMVDLIAKNFKKERNILYSNSETQVISINKSNTIKKETLLAPYADLSISDQQFNQMIKHYGDETKELLIYFQQAETCANQYQINHLLCAELLYAIKEAAIYTPLDFFIRRARIAYEKNDIQEQMTGILALLSDQLPWTKEERSYFERELKIWLRNQFE